MLMNNGTTRWSAVKVAFANLLFALFPMLALEIKHPENHAVVVLQAPKPLKDFRLTKLFACLN